MRKEREKQAKKQAKEAARRAEQEAKARRLAAERGEALAEATTEGGDTIELRDNVTAGGVKTVATKKSASGKSNDKTIRYSTRRRTD